MPSSPARLALGALAAALPWASCAAPPPEGEPLDLAAARTLEAAGEVTDWRAGDRVLVRLELEDGGEEARTWFVRLSVPADASVPLVPGNRTFTLTVQGVAHAIHSADVLVEAEVYDGEGNLQDRSRSRVPERLVRTGYPPYCEWVLAFEAGEFGSDAEAAAEFRDAEALVGMISFPMLLLAVQENESLSDLLWEVVELPSFLTLLLSGGNVDVSLSAPEADGVRRLEPDERGPHYELELALLVEGEPALDLVFEVAASAPPLHLTAGVVAFRGTHPSDPARVLRGEVVEARRGPPPGWVVEDAGRGSIVFRRLEAPVEP